VVLRVSGSEVSTREAPAGILEGSGGFEVAGGGENRAADHSPAAGSERNSRRGKGRAWVQGAWEAPWDYGESIAGHVGAHGVAKRCAHGGAEEWRWAGQSGAVR